MIVKFDKRFFKQIFFLMLFTLTPYTFLISMKKGLGRFGKNLVKEVGKTGMEKVTKRMVSGESILPSEKINASSINSYNSNHYRFSVGIDPTDKKISPHQNNFSHKSSLNYSNFRALGNPQSKEKISGEEIPLQKGSDLVPDSARKFADDLFSPSSEPLEVKDQDSQTPVVTTTFYPPQLPSPKQTNEKSDNRGLKEQDNQDAVIEEIEDRKEELQDQPVESDDSLQENKGNKSTSKFQRIMKENSNEKIVSRIDAELQATPLSPLYGEEVKVLAEALSEIGTAPVPTLAPTQQSMGNGRKKVALDEELRALLNDILIAADLGAGQLNNPLKFAENLLSKEGRLRIKVTNPQGDRVTAAVPARSVYNALFPTLKAIVTAQTIAAITASPTPSVGLGKGATTLASASSQESTLTFPLSTVYFPKNVAQRAVDALCGLKGSRFNVYDTQGALVYKISVTPEIPNQKKPKNSLPSLRTSKALRRPRTSSKKPSAEATQPVSLVSSRNPAAIPELSLPEVENLINVKNVVNDAAATTADELALLPYQPVDSIELVTTKEVAQLSVPTRQEQVILVGKLILEMLAKAAYTPQELFERQEALQEMVENNDTFSLKVGKKTITLSGNSILYALQEGEKETAPLELNDTDTNYALDNGVAEFEQKALEDTAQTSSQGWLERWFGGSKKQSPSKPRFVMSQEFARNFLDALLGFVPSITVNAGGVTIEGKYNHNSLALEEGPSSKNIPIRSPENSFKKPFPLSLPSSQNLTKTSKPIEKSTNLPFIPSSLAVREPQKSLTSIVPKPVSSNPLLSLPKASQPLSDTTSFPDPLPISQTPVVEVPNPSTPDLSFMPSFPQTVSEAEVIRPVISGPPAVISSSALVPIASSERSKEITLQMILNLTNAGKIIRDIFAKKSRSTSEVSVIELVRSEEVATLSPEEQQQEVIDVGKMFKELFEAAPATDKERRKFQEALETMIKNGDTSVITVGNQKIELSGADIVYALEAYKESAAQALTATAAQTPEALEDVKSTSPSPRKNADERKVIIPKKAANAFVRSFLGLGPKAGATFSIGKVLVKVAYASNPLALTEAPVQSAPLPVVPVAAQGPLALPAPPVVSTTPPPAGWVKTVRPATKGSPVSSTVPSTSGPSSSNPVAAPHRSSTSSVAAPTSPSQAPVPSRPLPRPVRATSTQSLPRESDTTAAKLNAEDSSELNTQTVPQARPNAEPSLEEFIEALEKEAQKTPPAKEQPQRTQKQEKRILEELEKVFKKDTAAQLFAEPQPIEVRASEESSGQGAAEMAPNKAVPSFSGGSGGPLNNSSYVPAAPKESFQDTPSMPSASLKGLPPQERASAERNTPKTVIPDSKISNPAPSGGRSSGKAVKNNNKNSPKAKENEERVVQDQGSTSPTGSIAEAKNEPSSSNYSDKKPFQDKSAPVSVSPSVAASLNSSDKTSSSAPLPSPEKQPSSEKNTIAPSAVSLESGAIGSDLEVAKPSAGVVTKEAVLPNLLWLLLSLLGLLKRKKSSSMNSIDALIHWILSFFS